MIACPRLVVVAAAEAADAVAVAEVEGPAAPAAAGQSVLP